MADDSPSELRDRWKVWIQRALGGSPSQVDRGADAAMAAIAGGATQNEAADAARAAWGGEVVTQGAEAIPAPRGAESSTERKAAGMGPPPRRGRIRGRVAGFQQRNELQGRKYLSVWDFRVEREDERGSPLPPIAVEMRGFRFEGAVANGDEVEIKGKAKFRKVLHVRSLDNLTSNSTVTVQKGSRGCGLGCLTSLIFFGVAAATLTAILQSL